MTTMMILEIEENVEFDCVMRALNEVDATYMVEEGKILGNLDKSKAYFVFSKYANSSDVSAEGFTGLWKAGMSAAFHCPNDDLAMSWKEIKSYMLSLAKLCECSFVLSFQYEKIYSIGSAGKIQFINEIVY